jgi:hypothetical protein
LVALYRKGPAKTFGTVYRGQTWFNGAAVNVTLTEVINDIEWRNSLFERCDSRGIRLETAQYHAAPDGLGTDLRGRG